MNPQPYMDGNTVILPADSPRPARFAPLVRWISKGGFAILDQALISGSNFIMATLLARWVTPAEYGAYSLAFSVFLLLSIIYQAVLLEPMMVFGGGAEKSSIRGYLRILFRLHIIVSCIMFAALGISTALASLRPGQGSLSWALAGAAIASPCVLLFWLVRRAFYLDVSVARAATGAVVYCIVLLCLFFLLEWRGLMSSFAAFTCMAAAAVATALLLLRQLWRALPEGGQTGSLRQTWKSHWRYGRWALAGSVASWVPAYVYYPLLGTFSGIVQSGELRALMNFAQPLAQFYAALSPVFLPYAARQRISRGRKGATSAAWKTTLLFVLTAVAYWAVLVPFRSTAMRLIYGAKYNDLGSLMPAVALGSLLWSGTIGVSIVLRAMESPRSIFIAFCAASLVSVVVGIPASRYYGVAGAVWAMNVSDAVAVFTLIILFRLRLAIPAGSSSNATAF